MWHVQIRQANAEPVSSNGLRSIAVTVLKLNAAS